jgi:hypothetical protein
LKRFGAEFFGSRRANTKLMCSPKFYEAFRDYKYVLVYQLDCLVFSDRLAEWCASDFDYIGAPWIPCPDVPWITTPAVGNGGFSLRKVESFLGVLNSTEYWRDPAEYALPKKFLLHVKALNGVRQHLRRAYMTAEGQEDLFWSRAAAKYYPGFSIPTVEQALGFAFETAPRECFELNHRQLPFGCHAWSRYDRAFWEPHLLGAERTRSAAMSTLIQECQL